MKLFAPDYYNNFKCIADKCKHNCCIGWEIDIDDEAVELYSSVTGDFGHRLKTSISCSDGISHFILSENERCPFLNNNNLCDIITTLGEDKLCNICNDHPRFRNFFSAHTEIGLGLCCEEAGKIILSMKEKTKIIPLDSSSDIPYNDEEIAFSILRNNLFDIAQDREFSIDERIEHIMIYINSQADINNISKWKNFYLSLERLDGDWENTLSRLDIPSSVSSEWDIVFEQLLCYFLYRHLPEGLWDGMLEERINFCILSFHIIRHICGTYENLCLDDIIETSRQYSSEIEYSEENIQAILSKL